MANSKDVAALARTSQTTVSRVFRGVGSVDETTRQRVLDAARQLQYIPSESARALIAGRTRRVALVVEQLTRPAFAMMADHAHRRLVEDDRRLAIIESDAADGSLDESSRRQLSGVDGLLYTSARLTTDVSEIMRHFARPIVFALRKPATPKIDNVLPDYLQGARAAVEHLADLGHRDIAMIGADPTITAGVSSGRAFQRAMSERGLPVPTVVGSPMRYGDGIAAMRSLLDLHRRPTAVFAADDLTAYAAIDVARERGLDVPGDLSVIGFDDFEMSGWMSFNLTTVRTPYDHIMDRAIDVLVQRIDGGQQAPVNIRVAVELIVRGSTAPANNDGRG